MLHKPLSSAVALHLEGSRVKDVVSDRLVSSGRLLLVHKISSKYRQTKRLWMHLLFLRILFSRRRVRKTLCKTSSTIYYDETLSDCIARYQKYLF